MSRSPASDMCSVRGIGVAESASTSHLEPQLAQELLLRDAEALLLVEDDEPEILRHDVAREHPVRADQDVHPARRGTRRGLRFTSAGRRKRETISTPTGRSR